MNWTNMVSVLASLIIACSTALGAWAAFSDISAGWVDADERFKSLNEQRCRLDALLLEAEVV